ncbi:hypothetical protein QBC38DRAFT_369015 [Podospora fimiseda]|uniref:UBZ4-type domain-containing protein n=1 Tax=Podospora fimiseda TaxID=252190 RepID=A0AAN7BL52_9PEZI|nr:hypothetical protein QBC38DRAFT_369015 [Podospora fimiseda]
MHRVPTTKQVVPGAQVNIVLKADQPTGRTVSGTIKDVLTKGEHHRGIKVRLVDGRIGRVQSMAGQDGGSPSSSGPGMAEIGNEVEDTQLSYGRRGRQPRFVRDVRTDQYSPPAPDVAVGLDAYIKPAKDKQRRGGRGAPASEPVTGTSYVDGTDDLEDVSAVEDVATCPVCNDFRGDATAIAHHVASHFDD